MGQTQNPALQRVCRAGRSPVQRPGPAGELLTARPASRARPAPARLNWLPLAIYTGGTFPLLMLASDAAHGLLGANPLQRALHQTGQLALALLLLSLACTPLRLLAGRMNRRLTWPARIRKALGMLAFGYAALHLSLYLLDQGLVPVSWLTVGLADIYKRPFITAGVLALLLLLPLALTSTPRSVARLGFARWTRLHQLVYPAAVLAVLHYWWAVKQDRAVPFLAALVLAGLLLLRWLLRPPKR